MSNKQYSDNKYSKFEKIITYYYIGKFQKFVIIAWLKKALPKVFRLAIRRWCLK